MLQALKIFARGYIKAYNDKLEIIYENPNAVQPLAKEAVSKLLAQRLEYAPAFIELFTNNVSQGKYPITTTTIVDSNTISYSILVPPNNPVTLIDTLNLITGTNGVFSISTGLALTKPANQNILITWTLNII